MSRTGDETRDGSPVSSHGDRLAPHRDRGDAAVAAVIVVVEYAIIASLLLVSVAVLIRTVVDFLGHTGSIPESITPAVDGILVVIILLDVVQTVFRHLHDDVLPVRPFLVIGVLAGVRDILSASAHLTLGANLTARDFDHTVIELGVGVGVVAALLLGLLVLSRAGEVDAGA